MNATRLNPETIPKDTINDKEADPHGHEVMAHANETGVARSTVYDGNGIASSIANDKKVQTEAQQRSSVVELYVRKLQNAGEESVNGPSYSVKFNP